MADTTILVVDDEPQIRRVLRTTLSGNGYDVILAKEASYAKSCCRISGDRTTARRQKTFAW